MNSANPPSTRGFLYPLNVYAWVLERLEQECKYLHFGIFNKNNETIGEAQRRSTDLLLINLPPPPAKILEVGTGTGALLGQLRGLGYQVVGINPDKRQVDYANSQHATDLEIQVCSFESYETSMKFDVIIFQEVSQYVELERLFSKSRQLLNKSGILLIVDEMKSTDSASHLHNIFDYSELGEQYNYQQVLNLDLTDRAMPTLHYLRHNIEKHTSLISAELELSQHDVLQLIHDINASEEKYRQREHLYCMLGFKAS
jgi:cyclopropane fatty-acyl-phospholipid synthase-like methyltransferase